MLTTENLQPIRILFVSDQKCETRILSHGAWGNATFDKGFVVVSPRH